jgi:hypothetical protein
VIQVVERAGRLAANRIIILQVARRSVRHRGRI